MEFLESLYSIENFGIYLFVVIGVLVIAFLMILFFGKKDEMKRKDEQKDDLYADTFKETSTSTPLEAVESSMPSKSSESDRELPVVNEEDSVSAVEDIPVPIAEKEFDFDALAAAISKELESIEDNNQEKEEDIEPTVVEPVFADPITFDETEEVAVEPVLSKVEEAPMNYQIFEPVREDLFSSIMDITDPVDEEQMEETPVEPVLFPIESEPVIPVVEEIEEPKKPSRPAVFSSVYVNRNVEEPKIMEEQKVVSDFEEENSEVVAPVVPRIELPKMMDLPKKK